MAFPVGSTFTITSAISQGLSHLATEWSANSSAGTMYEHRL